MIVNLTGAAIDRPENMSIKANLAWDYLQINSGGWVVVSAGMYELIAMDEGCDLNNSIVFCDEDDLVEWLNQTADDAISDNSVEFLVESGAVNPSLLNIPGVLENVLDAIKIDYEKSMEWQNATIADEYLIDKEAENK